MSAKRIFVYEYLSAGGALAADVADDAAADAALLAQGLAMRDAVVADLLRADEFSVCVAGAAGMQAPAGPARTVVPKAGEAPVDFVARQAAKHDLTWVIAPETAGLLAQLQDAVSPARRLGCDGPAIRLTTSKQATLRRLADRGLPTPLAFAQSTDITRWVVKPDDGAGGIATRVYGRHASARDDWVQRSDAGAATTLEPWLDGEALSISLLCGRRGSDPACELLSVNRQHITIDRHGSVAYHGVSVNICAPAHPRSVALRALAAGVVAAIPGLRGFVGIDLVWHARRGPVVIEVNPRLTCAYVGLSAALGRNLAHEVVDAHLRANERAHPLLQVADANA